MFRSRSAAGSPEEPRQLDGGCVQHLAANAREGGELDRGLPFWVVEKRGGECVFLMILMLF